MGRCQCPLTPAGPSLPVGDVAAAAILPALGSPQVRFVRSRLPGDNLLTARATTAAGGRRRGLRWTRR
ncbi:hypothetical protein chiPu_0025281, partial [Chiloscyllium punctatum]|nr:hypothetical protein [Chiloscyllium punctatum]